MSERVDYAVIDRLYPANSREGFGYLYAVAFNDGEYIKIGISNHPVRRFKEIQRGLPGNLQTGYCFHLENYARWEQVLHKRYSQYRTNGEWFCFPEHVFAWFFHDMRVLEAWVLRRDMRENPEEYR